MVDASSDAPRYRVNLQGEIDSAFVYRAMAAAEKSPQLASVYVRLAQVEERHLSFWEERLRSVGVDPGPAAPVLASPNHGISGAPVRPEVGPADGRHPRTGRPGRL
jgi:rubrerythrin